MTAKAKSGLLGLTARITSAHVSNNQVAAANLPDLIEAIYTSLERSREPSATRPAEPAPAVPIDASVQPDRIICLEDGQAVKLLKPYLMRRHQLTPQQYRAKWKLPADYPMVAPSCAAQRRDVATKHGLGRTGVATPRPAAAATIQSAAGQRSSATVATQRPTEAGPNPDQRAASRSKGRPDADRNAAQRPARGRSTANHAAAVSPGEGPLRRTLSIVVPGPERRDSGTRGRSQAALSTPGSGPRRRTLSIAIPADTPQQNSVDAAARASHHHGGDGNTAPSGRSGTDAAEQPARS